MRKLRRMVAREMMKRGGLRQVCKDKGSGSYFSKHWREFA